MPALPPAAIHPVKLEAFVFRCPISTPVKTSFGTMHDRPALFVRAQDEDGAVGWGEVWCNFPSCGAEHRARLLDTVMAPLLLSRAYASPAEAFRFLSDKTAVLAIQSGEPGPMAQVIAGIDLALWDLCARRAGQPLWRFLGGTRDRIPVYASGINPDQPEVLAAAKRQEGYRAFKLKVGFGEARDLANLRALRSLLGDEAPLMVDANQGWDLAEATRMAPLLHDFRLGWLEEPLRADRPWSEWKQLATATRIPLAGGENLLGEEAFATAIAQSPLAVMQPDLAKWGGISGCWPVVVKARDAGLRYCPHFLGGGIGLLASAHVLAAAGGDGMLEIDANPNPLRTLLSPRLSVIDGGACTLGDAPGIGVTPDLARVAETAARGC
ncbi:mandelate racemase/muconate lactonizing enzyme family protein [Caenimonas sp. DR4.4]|uniref:Mandelate racemase/muconate lactonizing enzyme family protein n=1 Tax=Caenimonas aquaedulcis TaxID=2793270 RepID=A0A931MFU9_9BURK|nr:mandelate racemase/muconate lactonizing enzyme family protein [Caenimonas aquaedulcis]MBG9387558.1 mandelate racemase/muconate lactonizing enzyme family protein [Caenimonas aquaedulcis]